MHGDKLEALERFDVAAQMWGWEKDQGVGNSVNEAAKEYEAAREALITALASPPLQPLLNAKSPPPSNRVNMVLPASDAATPPVSDGGEADSGMSGDAVERAELFWAQLPINRKWAALQTHEKALVCHLLARVALTPPVDGGEFVMVPREPTEAMLDAGQDLWLGEDNRSPDWGSKLAETWSAMLAASPSRPSPSPEQREVVARRLHDRFIERSKARVTYDPDDAGCYANTPWERLPMSFKRDYYADAEAVLSALCDRGE